MSEALALPTNSAPAPANSAMVIFRMSSSSFVQYLPSASSRVALFRSPRIERSDHPAWPPRGFGGPWFGKKEQRFPGRLRDYRCITHDNRTYVIEPRDGRPLRRSTSGKGKAAHPGSLSPSSQAPLDRVLGSTRARDLEPRKISKMGAFAG